MIILLFEDARLGRAEDEMFALGHDFTECFVRHCERIDRGAVDLDRLALFAEHEGIPIFRASVDDAFVIYGVEEAPPENEFMILAAGRHGRPAEFGPTRWNGLDYEHFRQDVVLTRAAATYLPDDGGKP